MAFTLFTPLFNKIDTATATFVSDISSNEEIPFMVKAETPWISKSVGINFRKKAFS